jgi:hypothetical protein
MPPADSKGLRPGTFVASLFIGLNERHFQFSAWASSIRHTHLNSAGVGIQLWNLPS